MTLRFSLIAALLFSVAIAAAEERDRALPSSMLALDEFAARSHDALTGYFLVPLKLPQCSNLKADSDLGPFIQSAIKHEDDELVVLVPPNAKEPFRAVSFRKGIPVAFSERMRDAKDAAADVEAHRVAIQQAAPRSKTEWTFERGELVADDGTKVAALQIVTPPAARTP